MTIEFKCSFCDSTLRVPDENAGMRARCPSCQTIVSIPWNATPPAPVEQPFTSAPAPNPYRDFDVQDSTSPAQPQSQPFEIRDEPAPFVSTNPYAGRPAAPTSTSSANPYQPTISTSTNASSSDALTNRRLLTTGIIMLVFTIPMILGLSVRVSEEVLTYIQTGRWFVRPQEFIFGVLFITGQVLAFIGAICMIRRRGHTLAMIGAVAQILSGWACCCFPSLIGLYALSVLTNLNSKRLMQGE